MVSRASGTRPSEQRNKWRLIAHGIGMHWEEIDEDIAVTTLLRMYDRA